MKQLKYASTAAIALALAACGGGGDDEETVPAPYAGAQAVQTVLSDGEVIHEDTYTYLEISQEGQLSLQALPAAQGTQQYFPVDLSKATIPSNSALALNGDSELISTPPSINQAEALAQASTAFQALWQALDKHYQGKLHVNQLLEQVQDLDGDLATLYADYLASGLDMDAYIHLYEQIDLYFNGDLDEMLLRQFFLDQDITAAQFLERLEMAGLTVNSFFQQMKDRQLNISDIEQYFNEKLVFNRIRAQDKKIKNLSYGLNSFADMWCMVQAGSYTLHNRDCTSQLPVLFSNRWNTSYYPIENSIYSVLRSINTDATSKIGRLNNKHRLIPLYTYTDESAYEDYFYKAHGNEKTIKTNDIEFRGTLLGFTTYHIKMHLEATVGTSYSGKGKWVKKIKPVYSKKEKTKSGGWAVDDIKHYEILKPDSSSNISHIVSTTVGIVINTGTSPHSYLLFSNVLGDDTNGDYFKLTAVKP